MRPALLYPLMVGLPIIAIVGILRVGERITPPPALGGSWAAERSAGTGEPPELLVSSCGDPVEPRAIHGVELQQSGRTATVAIRDAAGARWAEGSVALRADDRGAADGTLTLAGCSSATVGVTLVPDGMLRPRTMDISLEVRDCADCAPVKAHLTHAAHRTTTSTAPGH